MTVIKKVALFDFCETLANYQTADPFVYHCINHCPSTLKKIEFGFLRFCNRMRIVSLLQKLMRDPFLGKRLTIRLLKGLPKNEVQKYGESYYRETVKPNLIKRIIYELKNKQADGYSIYIVSGGYDAYLYHFIKDFNIPQSNLVCTRIQYKNDCCTGKWDGADCMNDNKVVAIDKILSKSDVHAIVYTDSKSDLPIIRWADEAVIVRKKNYPSWDINKEFKEITWY